MLTKKEIFLLSLLFILFGVLTMNIWLHPFGYRSIGVIGDSMFPTITKADVVLIDMNYNYRELKQGDIICYKLKLEGTEYLYTHRILKIENGLIKTKGDNLPEPDPWLIGPEDIVGKVVFVLPKIGSFLKFINTPYGFLIFIFFPSVFIVLIELRKLRP